VQKAFLFLLAKVDKAKFGLDKNTLAKSARIPLGLLELSLGLCFFLQRFWLAGPPMGVVYAQGQDKEAT